MSGPLAGRRALVTGADRGIGAACARRLAADGAGVDCADLRLPEATAAAIREAGGTAAAHEVDVASEASVMALYAALDAAGNAPDIVVNAAGVMLERALAETTAEVFDHVVGINLRGSFLIGREAIRRMTARGEGRVILVASDLAHVGRETFSAYCASKHGVIGLVRSWAREAAPGVKVNALSPGPTDTAMLGAAQMSPEWRARELDIPAGRFGRPEEIADWAALLAGPSGDFVTGQSIGVNGGAAMP